VRSQRGTEESLTCSIKSISLLTDRLGKQSHLSDTTSVVTDRSIGIDGETSGKVAEHADSRQGDSIEITESEGHIDDTSEDEHRDND
jgi:hypothetical protein